MKELFCLIFLFFFLFFSAPGISMAFTNEDAQRDIYTASEAAPIESALTSSSSGVPVDYQLAYHGLLPDNPLYFLKVIRDRLIDFLIADPLKKAEFYLLQADKHATSGVALFVKGKQELAESTISKGENYFEAGIIKLSEAKKQGTDIKYLSGRYAVALQKHKELVTGLIKQSGKEVKKKLEHALIRLKNFEKQVTSLRLD